MKSHSLSFILNTKIKESMIELIIFANIQFKTIKNSNHQLHNSNSHVQKDVNISATANENKSNPNMMKTIIDINGKEVNLLFHTGGDLPLISYECYVNVG